MIIGPFTLYRLIIAAALVVMVIAAGIWAMWDGLHDLRIRWRLRRHQMRHAPGHCTRCGYDIRANLDRCSECGEPVKKIAPPPASLLRK